MNRGYGTHSSSELIINSSFWQPTVDLCCPTDTCEIALQQCPVCDSITSLSSVRWDEVLNNLVLRSQGCKQMLPVCVCVCVCARVCVCMRAYACILTSTSLECLCDVMSVLLMGVSCWTVLLLFVNARVKRANLVQPARNICVLLKKYYTELKDRCNEFIILCVFLFQLNCITFCGAFIKYSAQLNSILYFVLMKALYKWSMNVRFVCKKFHRLLVICKRKTKINLVHGNIADVINKNTIWGQ